MIIIILIIIVVVVFVGVFSVPLFLMINWARPVLIAYLIYIFNPWVDNRQFNQLLYNK